MNKVLLILTFTLVSGLSYSQNGSLDYTIHSRVDVSNQEVNEIVSLWTNYLASRPDSIYNNPYWNKEEKKLYQDFDLTRPFLYQFPSPQLLSYYKPSILSIEKEVDHYAIRTMFAADGLKGKYRKSNPWCITKIYAVKENNQWKLKNALPIITEKWERKTVGKITFIFPSTHQFNHALAQKSNEFCDQLVKEFEFQDWKAFDYYITNSGDELGSLLGFDFFFTGYTTGMGMNDKRILLSGIGSEWYPHEFVHLIIPNKTRHGMINEGFATWQGGAKNKTFEENAKILAEQLAKNDTVTFTDILTKKWGWQFSAYYTTGALFCKLAYDKCGLEGLKLLLDTPSDDDKFVASICKIFDVDSKSIDKLIRTEAQQYLNK